MINSFNILCKKWSAGIFIYLSVFTSVYGNTVHLSSSNSSEEQLVSSYDRYISLGKDFARKKNFKTSVHYFDSALIIIRNTGNINDLEVVYSNLYISWKELQQFDSALYYHELLSVCRDTLFMDKEGERLRALMIKYEAERKINDLAVFNNKTLKQTLELKNKDLLINTALGSSFTLILIVIFIVIYRSIRQKRLKDIHLVEEAEMKKRKEIENAGLILLGQENERRRIALELHDGIGVLLTRANICFSEGSGNMPVEYSKLLKGQELIAQANQEIRSISQNMMPVVLYKMGLTAATEDLFEDVMETTNIKITQVIKTGTTRFGNTIEIMLFRVFQELVNNTLKHAQASRISFSMIKKGRELKIHFSDNGKGFNPCQVFHKTKLGLAGIRSRIELLSGDIAIHSTLNKGCTFDIAITIDE